MIQNGGKKVSYSNNKLIQLNCVAIFKVISGKVLLTNCLVVSPGVAAVVTGRDVVWTIGEVAVSRGEVAMADGEVALTCGEVGMPGDEVVLSEGKVTFH